MADKKLTSVKIDEKLWDEFRIAGVKYNICFYKKNLNYIYNYF